MNWSVVPGEPAVFEDYRGALWMVPDVQAFTDAVAGIDMESGSYRIEITDPENVVRAYLEHPVSNLSALVSPLPSAIPFVATSGLFTAAVLNIATWHAAATSVTNPNPTIDHEEVDPLVPPVFRRRKKRRLCPRLADCLIKNGLEIRGKNRCWHRLTSSTRLP